MDGRRQFHHKPPPPPPYTRICGPTPKRANGKMFSHPRERKEIVRVRGDARKQGMEKVRSEKRLQWYW